MIPEEDCNRQFISNFPKSPIFYTLKYTLKYMEHASSTQTNYEIKFKYIIST